MFRPAARPTLHFVGVSTAGSSINRVFPAWACHWQLDAELRGMDFPPGVAPERLREATAFIRDDPLSRGALVTTHKIDLFRAARDLFDFVDPFAALTGEASCLSKRDGRLLAHAKDPISSALALEAFVPPDHFTRTGAEALLLGAGGSAVAISLALARRSDRPPRIIVTDVAAERLDHLAALHHRAGAEGPAVELRLVRTAADNDAALAGLPPGSLVVNATGLGKDRPGSPLSPAARFPQAGLVWELNYRGSLVFLDQARDQADGRQLRVEDGWTYFLHGWTQVIAEVFALALPTRGPEWDRIAAIAAEASARG